MHYFHDSLRASANDILEYISQHSWTASPEHLSLWVRLNGDPHESGKFAALLCQKLRPQLRFSTPSADLLRKNLGDYAKGLAHVTLAEGIPCHELNGADELRRLLRTTLLSGPEVLVARFLPPR